MAKLDDEKAQAKPGPVIMMATGARSSLEALLRAFYDQVASGGRVDRVADFLTPDCLVYHPLSRDPFVGPGGLAQTVSTYHAAFPDIRHEITDLIVDGDKAAVRAIVRATNHGSWMGHHATHKPATWTTTEVFHFADGKICRMFVDEDLCGLAKQLGLNH